MSEPFQALPRRFKVAYIQPKDLLNCLTLNASVPGDTLVKVSLEGVPPGTRVIGRHYDTERYSECLLLYHESWTEVPLCQIPEEIKVTRTHIKVNGSIPRSETETSHPMVTTETDVSPDNATQPDNCLTVVFLDEHGDTIKEMSMPYTLQLNGALYPTDTSWRDRPPLL